MPTGDRGTLKLKLSLSQKVGLHGRSCHLNLGRHSSLAFCAFIHWPLGLLSFFVLRLEETVSRRTCDFSLFYLLVFTTTTSSPCFSFPFFSGQAVFFSSSPIWTDMPVLCRAVLCCGLTCLCCVVLCCACGLTCLCCVVLCCACGLTCLCCVVPCCAVPVD